ncbi:J domain-containing protein [Nocardioides sp. URHA0020]|uniref:J domain-containing protein n=1 Tax=Nocardioides sp. URHA0020 TaxID=1380392 RepID=UPI00048B1D96|nr:DnaJ domain-containing protein [Nocardioides sp. URHA0020]
MTTSASTPSPSWYDLLGVAPDASADDVRAAWRAAIADLDPTDRRFASLNRAAEVLLDPDRRAAYDAELAPPPEPEPEPEPEPTTASAGSPESSEAAEPAAAPARERRVVPGWLLVGVAVVTLLVAGAAAVVAATVPSDRSVEDASGAARAAAERAIVPILSYDATSLDKSRAAALPYLTSDYRKDYDELFDGVIKENAPSTGTVVATKLVDSGLVRADDERVQVFLLIDMTRTNKAEKQPVVYQNWVTVTMEKVDGDWLVAKLDT